MNREILEAEILRLLRERFARLSGEVSVSPELERELAVLVGRMARYWAAAEAGDPMAQRQLQVLQQTGRNVALIYGVRATSATTRAVGEWLALLAEVALAFLRAA